MRRAARTDGNHREIVEALRAAGAAVTDTSAVGGDERKAACARENLRFAVAANARKLLTMGTWKCLQCGDERPATVHQKRKKYCSRKCAAIAQRMFACGQANNNFKNAAERWCVSCGQRYESYDKRRKYCSRACFIRSDGVRGRLRKDSNHKEIVDALEKCGAEVFDLSRMGGGFPDIVVGYRGVWYLLEIKNPTNSYGKRGFSPRQKEWVDRQHAPVHLVRSIDEALVAIGAVTPAGDRWALDHVS